MLSYYTRVKYMIQCVIITYSVKDDTNSSRPIVFAACAISYIPFVKQYLKQIRWIQTHNTITRYNTIIPAGTFFHLNWTWNSHCRHSRPYNPVINLKCLTVITRRISYYIMIGEFLWGNCTVYRAFMWFREKNARLGNFVYYLLCVTPLWYFMKS